MNFNDVKLDLFIMKFGLFFGRFFYGWLMLGLISVIVAMNNAFFDKGLSLFLIPVGVSLGLNWVTVSFIFFLGCSEGVLNGLVVGYLVDWFGVRWIMVIGIILVGVGFIIFSLVLNLWVFALVYFGFVFLGVIMVF